MTDINIKNTRRKMEPQYLLCNDLIVLGCCMRYPHCRFQHIPDLMNNMNNLNTISEFAYGNFNLSPHDPSFNWNLSDSNKNMDKKALSMFICFFNYIAHKNIIAKDDGTYLYNNITKRKRLPIFCQLSTSK